MLTELTGEAFSQQMTANYGPHEFIFPEYDKTEMVLTKKCIAVVRRNDNKKRTLNIKILLNGTCMQFKEHPTDKRSFFIEKWAGSRKYKNIDFRYFVFYGMDISSAFYCREHQKFYYQKPKNFEKAPYCQECSDFIMNPSKYWLELFPGVIQSLYTGTGVEYTIPGTDFLVDGFDHFTKTVYEYNGCRTSHKCPVCLNEEIIEQKRAQMSKGKFKRWIRQDKYQKTIDKKKKCIELGYYYVDMWHCQWMEMRNSREKLTDYKMTQKSVYDRKIKEKIEEANKFLEICW